MKKLFGSICTVLVIAMLFCTDAKAANDTALSVAASLEAQGDYALAASAYMAMVDGFDFVPGPTQKNEFALNKAQKTLFGKCAMTCIERGMQLHLANGGSLADCAEFQMLASSANTMMELEPENANWSYLRGFALIQQGNLAEGDRLLDNALRLSTNDATTMNKALQAKSQVQAYLSRH